MAIGTAAAILGGAALGVGGSMLAAKSQGDAAESAAQTSASASNYAANIQKQMYNQTRADQAPWRKAGVNALSQLGTGTQWGGGLVRPFRISDFKTDPGYNFRLTEGIKALDRSAAARGNLLSGAQLKGISRYGQDFASNEYQNAYNRYNQNQANSFNRLASMAGLGQTANSALGQAGSNYANNTSNIAMTNAANQGNAQIAAGNASASSYQGLGNVATNALQTYGMLNYLSPQSQPQPQSYGFDNYYGGWT